MFPHVSGWPPRSSLQGERLVSTCSPFNKALVPILADEFIDKKDPRNQTEDRHTTDIGGHVWQSVVLATLHDRSHKPHPTAGEPTKGQGARCSGQLGQTTHGETRLLGYFLVSASPEI